MYPLLMRYLHLQNDSPLCADHLALSEMLLAV